MHSKSEFMIKKILYSFLFIAPFFSCTKDNVKISATCELMRNGVYLIEWETFPPMDGTVKI